MATPTGHIKTPITKNATDLISQDQPTITTMDEEAMGIVIMVEIVVQNLALLALLAYAVAGACWRHAAGDIYEAYGSGHNGA